MIKLYYSKMKLLINVCNFYSFAKMRKKNYRIAEMIAIIQFVNIFGVTL